MDLTELQLDFLKEYFNMGVGRGARVLNSMLNSHISLSVPEIGMINKLDKSTFPGYSESLAAVDFMFHGGLDGSCKLFFPYDSALKLVRQVSGEPGMMEETDFDAMSEGVLKEIGNIVLNSVIGVLSNSLKIQLHYSVPSFQECSPEELFGSAVKERDSVGLVARIHFSVESMDVQGEIMTVFKMDSFSRLLKYIDNMIDD